jgi:hypothetical protein
MAKAIDVKDLVIVAMFVSPGVAAGTGGFVIVNGKIKKLPPRGPLLHQLRSAIEAIAGRGRGR